MKNLKIALLLMPLLLGSCTDFLVLSPEFQLNDKLFYKTVQDFETATIGSYSQLQVIYNASI